MANQKKQQYIYLTKAKSCIYAVIKFDDDLFKNLNLKKGEQVRIPILVDKAEVVK